MARVYYLKELKEGGRAVAKVLRPELRKSRPHYERFLKEASVAMSLTPSPLLVQPIAFIRDYDQPYLLMQWVDGWTLAEWADQGRRTPVSAPSIPDGTQWAKWWHSWHDRDDHPYHEASLLFYWYNVCHALELLYNHGVVAHGDIHGRNIIIRKGHPPFAVLIDLGLAKSADLVVGDTIDLLPVGKRRDIAGCLPYLAPELFRGDAEPSPTTDVYALGVTIYSALSGRLPYDLGFAADLGELRPLANYPLYSAGIRFPSEIGTRYRECIVRCLSPNPTDRFESPVVLREEITGILQQSYGLAVKLEYSSYDQEDQETYDSHLFNQAIEIRAREPDRAIALIKEILTRHPNDEHARRCFQVWAQTLLEVHQYPEADRVIRRALAFGNPSFHALNTFGLIQNSLARYDDAEDILRRALAVAEGESQRTIALANLSLVKQRRGKVAEADALLAEAGAISDNPRVLLRQAYAEYRKECWETAAQIAKSVTELDPLEFEAWDILGSSSFQMHKYDDAYKAFEKGLVLKPSDAAMLARIAYAAAHLGRSKGEILALLDRAAAAGVDNADIDALRAAASTGEEARQHAARALQKDPHHWLAQRVVRSAPTPENKPENKVVSKFQIPKDRLLVIARSMNLSEPQIKACVEAIFRVVTAASNSSVAMPRTTVDQMLSGFDNTSLSATCKLLIDVIRSDPTARTESLVIALQNLGKYLEKQRGTR